MPYTLRDTACFRCHQTPNPMSQCKKQANGYEQPSFTSNLLLQPRIHDASGIPSDSALKQTIEALSTKAIATSALKMHRAGIPIQESACPLPKRLSKSWGSMVLLTFSTAQSTTQLQSPAPRQHCRRVI